MHLSGNWNLPGSKLSLPGLRLVPRPITRLSGDELRPRSRVCSSVPSSSTAVTRNDDDSITYRFDDASPSEDLVTPTCDSSAPDTHASLAQETTPADISTSKETAHPHSQTAKHVISEPGGDDGHDDHTLVHEVPEEEVYNYLEEPEEEWEPSSRFVRDYVQPGYDETWSINGEEVWDEDGNVLGDIDDTLSDEEEHTPPNHRVPLETLAARHDAFDLDDEDTAVKRKDDTPDEDTVPPANTRPLAALASQAAAMIFDQTPNVDVSDATGEDKSSSESSEDDAVSGGDSAVDVGPDTVPGVGSGLDNIQTTKGVYTFSQPAPGPGLSKPTLQDDERRQSASKASTSDTADAPKKKYMLTDVPAKLNFDSVVVHSSPAQLRDLYSSLIYQDRLGDALQLMQRCKTASRPEALFRMSHKQFFTKAIKLRDAASAMRYLEVLPSDLATAQTYHLAMNVAKAMEDLPLGMSMLSHMRNANIPATLYIYTNLFTVCARVGDAEAAFQLYADMAEHRICPDAHAFTALASACTSTVEQLRQQMQTSTVSVASARRQQLVLIDRALGLLKTMKLKKIEPDAAMWNTLIKCTGHSGQLIRSFELLNDMVASQIKPNAVTFVTLIDACCKENERTMALQVYSMAERAEQINLQVVTAALDACLLLSDTLDTRYVDFQTGLRMYDILQAKGITPDLRFLETLIAVIGRNGSLDHAIALVDDIQALNLRITPRTVCALLQACLESQDLERAMQLYQTFRDEHKVLPSISQYNALIIAHGRRGDLSTVTALADDLVSSGTAMTTGTFAAILGACQQARGHELAFQAYAVLKQRGIATDRVLAMILIRTCFNKIRYLWDEKGYPPSAPNSKPEPVNVYVDSETASRLLFALTGRSGLVVDGDGSKDPGDWRNRAHQVYCDMQATSIDPDVLLLERLLSCMRKSAVDRRAVKRALASPRSGVSATSIGVAGSDRRRKVPDRGIPQAVTEAAQLDRRFESRAYVYVEEAVLANVLPSMAIDSDRTIDLRDMPPTTAEAYVLALFAQVYARIGNQRKRFMHTIVFLMPAFDRLAVDVPSWVDSRKEARKVRKAERMAPKPKGGVSLDNLYEDWPTIQGQVSDFSDRKEQSIVRTLERNYDIDLSCYSTPAAQAKTPNPVNELSGLAVVSALRRLRMRYIVEPKVGVVICESDSITAWSAYRYTALVDRRARTQRRAHKAAQVVPYYTSNSGSDDDSDVEVPIQMPTPRVAGAPGSLRWGIVNQQRQQATVSDWTEPEINPFHPPSTIPDPEL